MTVEPILKDSTRNISSEQLSISSTTKSIEVDTWKFIIKNGRSITKFILIIKKTAVNLMKTVDGNFCTFEKKEQADFSS